MSSLGVSVLCGDCVSSRVDVYTTLFVECWPDMGTDGYCVGVEELCYAAWCRYFCLYCYCYACYCCCLWIYCLSEFDSVITWLSWKLVDQSMSNGRLITSTHSQRTIMSTVASSSSSKPQGQGQQMELNPRGIPKAPFVVCPHYSTRLFLIVSDT